MKFEELWEACQYMPDIKTLAKAMYDGGARDRQEMDAKIAESFIRKFATYLDVDSDWYDGNNAACVDIAKKIRE